MARPLKYCEEKVVLEYYYAERVSTKHTPLKTQEGEGWTAISVQQYAPVFLWDSLAVQPSI